MDGKNPLKYKQYVGESPKGKTIILVDDMISSGGTILETAKELKKMGAARVFVCATFGLFTRRTMDFIKAYQKGIVAKTYITNLTYLDTQPMYGIEVIDGTEQLLECIHALHANKEDIREELGTNFVPVSELIRRRKLK